MVRSRPLSPHRDGSCASAPELIECCPFTERLRIWSFAGSFQAIEGAEKKKTCDPLTVIGWFETAHTLREALGVSVPREFFQCESVLRAHCSAALNYVHLFDEGDKQRQYA